MNKNIKIFALLICMLMTTSVIWADDNASDFYFPEGMTWTVRLMPLFGGCDPRDNVFVLQGDTLINGKIYHTVRYLEVPWLVFPLTADGKKIYAHIYGRDILLYDFGLEVGDSILHYQNIRFDADAPEDLRFGSDSAYIYVSEVDSITLLDGRRAKRLHYRRYQDEHYRSDIEYIGCANGGLFSIIDVPLQTTCGGNWCCCSLNGEPIYEEYPGLCEEMDIHGTSPNAYLPSLCDTWNVLFVRMGANGDELSTEVHRLTTDTVINGKTYVQLYIYGNYGVRDRVTYRGALREDNNANVYIVPANSDHEYLLYAFNAKVGDKLSNLWIGGAAETGGLPDGLNATVADITESSPRIFTLYLDIDEYHPIQWIEGVGLTDCPGGSICPAVLGCGCSCGHIMLCAYKDGKQVYASEEAEKYGCYYDSAKQPADTVALYWRSGDGPGSTTVTPVDPNQVVATLNDNLLTIREQSGEEVTYSLAVTPISHAPARHELPEAQKEVAADTFRNSVAVQLSEDGSYTLTLSKAGWENDIYGTFDYTASGLQPIAATDAPARKLLRNGQLFIQQGDKIFTLTGVLTK